MPIEPVNEYIPDGQAKQEISGVSTSCARYVCAGQIEQSEEPGALNP